MNDQDYFEKLLRDGIRERLEEIIKEETDAAKDRVEKRMQQITGTVCEGVLRKLKFSSIGKPEHAEVEFVVRLPL